MPIQPRTRPLKFDGLAEKSEKDTVPYLSTKVLLEERGRPRVRRCEVCSGEACVPSAHVAVTARLENTWISENYAKAQPNKRSAEGLRDLSWKIRYRIFLRFCSQTTKLYRARSLLYRHQSLQVNTHFAVFSEIYKIVTLSHRSRLKISAKNRQNFFGIFQKNTKFRSFFLCSSEFAPILIKFSRNFAEYCREGWEFLIFFSSIFFLFGGSFASLIMMFDSIRITIFFSNSGWG